MSLRENKAAAQQRQAPFGQTKNNRCLFRTPLDSTKNPDHDLMAAQTEHPVSINNQPIKLYQPFALLMICFAGSKKKMKVKSDN